MLFQFRSKYSAFLLIGNTLRVIILLKKTNYILDI